MLDLQSSLSLRYLNPTDFCPLDGCYLDGMPPGCYRNKIPKVQRSVNKFKRAEKVKVEKLEKPPESLKSHNNLVSKLQYGRESRDSMAGKPTETLVWKGKSRQYDRETSQGARVKFTKSIRQRTMIRPLGHTFRAITIIITNNDFCAHLTCQNCIRDIIFCDIPASISRPKVNQVPLAQTRIKCCNDVLSRARAL